MSESEEQDQFLNTEYRRKLPCPLTAKEVSERAFQLTELLNEEEQIEAEMKASGDTFKARLKSLNKVIKEVRRQIDVKAEIREVAVMDIPNHESKMIEVHRLDRRRSAADRIVTQRPMTLMDEAEASEEQTDEGMALADAAVAENKERKRKGRKKAAVAEPEEIAEAESRRKKAGAKIEPKAARTRKRKGNGRDETEAHEAVESDETAADGDGVLIGGAVWPGRAAEV